MNILDILDTMVASDVETSVAANGVRENVLACTGGPIAVIIIIDYQIGIILTISIILNIIIRRQEEEKTVQL